MIPAYFMPLERIPLTASGKIDRNALPDPGLSPDSGYSAPRDAVESKLAEIWAGVLETDAALIGINDSFFQLGGHSLKATFLSAKIHKSLDVRVPMELLFESPTIAGMADFIRSARETLHYNIEAVEKREYYPQSSAQKRLFFLDRFEDIGTGYNMPFQFTITGPLEPERFESAFQLLIRRHESLRTSFHLIDNQPVQRVHETCSFSLENPEELSRSFVRPFDLSQAPLLRAGIQRISEGEYSLMFDMHHIIGDGSSSGILIDDLIQLYHDPENKNEGLRPLRIQYKDFACWQNRLYETRRIGKQIDYWLDIFPPGEAVPRLNLRTDYPRPPVFRFDGNRHVFSVNGPEAAGVRAFCRETGATLYMAAMTALNILLHRYTGQEDIVVGTGIMGSAPCRFAASCGHVRQFPCHAQPARFTSVRAGHSQRSERNKYSGLREPGTPVRRPCGTHQPAQGFVTEPHFRCDDGGAEFSAVVQTFS